MKKYIILTLLVTTLSCLFSLVPTISNIGITADSVNVYINYQLDADGQCQVMVIASDDAGSTFRIYPTALTGDIGNSVIPGGRKQIIWNYLTDNIEAGDNFQVKLIARDNPLEDDDNFLSFTRVNGGMFYEEGYDTTISTFFMDKYEITQGEYEAVMGVNPAHTNAIGIALPVYFVSWFDAVKYCNIRSIQEGLTPCYDYNNEGTNPDNWSEGWDLTNNHENYNLDINASGYRLPTLREWLYAGKGGDQTDDTDYDAWAGTDNEAQLTQYAWYIVNSESMVHQVGLKLPNALGLYDMSGNINEWCWDVFGDYSEGYSQVDPVGPLTGQGRACKGGFFDALAFSTKVTGFFPLQPSVSNYSIGFRIVRRIEETQIEITPTPQVSPQAGFYETEQTITMTSDSGRSDIYYTLDGSEPSSMSTHYTGPFTLSETTTVKARAYRVGWQPSEIITIEYEIEIMPENFVLVEGGTFYNGYADISVSSFIMSKYEVTQGEYEAIMGVNSNYFVDADNPAESINWFNAVKYCNLRSILGGLTPCYEYSREGRDPANWSEGWDLVNNHYLYSCDFTADGYRLPTEMEWMFAAKGGNQTPATDYNSWAGTDDSLELTDYAWFLTNSVNTTHHVGSKLPNQLGLYDMSGNVFEWCWDRYATYNTYAQTDPVGSYEGSYRIYRGGSWLNGASNCSVHLRTQRVPSTNNNYLGMRLVRRIENIPLEATSNPAISPEAGTYRAPQTITLNSFQSDVDIYYTLDGSEPNLASNQYTIPFIISDSTTVKFRAYKEGCAPSEILTAIYEIDVIINDFITVVGGTFYNAISDVTISSFLMNRYEITQGEYEEVMGSNPAHNYGEGYDYPVYSVSWFDALKFCNIRSLQDGLTPCYSYSNEGSNPDAWSIGWNSAVNHTNFTCDFSANGYRLPTEMEWMYAAKGGNQTPASGFDQYSGDSYWYSGNNSPYGTKPVGILEANQLGLYDMSGNVFEWNWDIYGEYEISPQVNPYGPEIGEDRIIRGGSWNYGQSYCQVDYRYSYTPSDRITFVGFRLARSLDTSTPQVTPAPTFSSQAGINNSVQIISINCEYVDAEIFYTLDTNEPNASDNFYSGPLYISHSTTIKARAYRPGWERSEVGSIEYNIDEGESDLVFVEGGTFTMGRTTDLGNYQDELPPHQVTLSSFYIGKYEVTQADYEDVMGNNPSIFPGEDMPLAGVTWVQAVLYCNTLSNLEGLTPCYQGPDWICDFTANGYRLPTEAEWEYAARGASMNPDYNYAGSNTVSSVAWHYGNSEETTHPIGTKTANSLGIYDMSGNVKEWCYDRYGYYSSEAQTNPIGPDTGSQRVFRGGSWDNPSNYSRVSKRGYYNPTWSYDNVGFRIVKNSLD